MGVIVIEGEGRAKATAFDIQPTGVNGINGGKKASAHEGCGNEGATVKLGKAENEATAYDDLENGQQIAEPNVPRRLIKGGEFEMAHALNKCAEVNGLSATSPDKNSPENDSEADF